MKGKVFIAGSMLLLSLSLLGCSNEGGAPGSTNSDSTGVIINSVSIKSDSTPPPNPNIDVFSTSTTTTTPGLTSEVVTLNIDAEKRNDTGLSEPFPATVQECTITYLKAFTSSPNIPSLTIFPDCILLSSTADKPDTCTVTLIDVQRKNDYWNATNQGLNLPPDYPTHYTAQYNCQYRSNFEKDGSFKVVYDFWLADFPLLSTVPVGSVVVSANPTIVASGATSAISAAVTDNVGDPVPDDTTVTFTSTAGSLVPFVQTKSGLATSTFTAPIVTADTNVTVTASVGVKSDPTGVISDSTTLRVVPSITPIIVPGAASLPTTGGTAKFTITGGIGPYTTVSSNPTLVCNNSNPAVLSCSDPGDTGTWTSVAGQSITATVPQGATVDNITLTVTDSVGKTTTATISIIAPGSSLAVTPTSSAPLHCQPGGGPETFVITSGVPPFTVTSGNSAVTIAGSPVNAVGDSFTATLTTGSCDSFTGNTAVSVNVQDSNTPKSFFTVTVNVLDP